MGVISGDGEIDSPVLNLADRLRKLGFIGEGEGAATLLGHIGLPTEMPVDGLNRWLQVKLASVATDLSWQEGTCEVAVTSEMTAAFLGLALLSGEGTETMINRLRRAVDV